MRRRELGDWQTPLPLARAVLELVAREGAAPASILEPTCGAGSFLVAAREQFPAAQLRGYEREARHARSARAALRGSGARISVADFFGVDWERELAGLSEPVLVTGNPPWVTNAALGVLGSKNLPEKSNFKRMRGYDALTGKSNFDVSEWMLLRLLDALEQRRATIAVLCKAAVARRIVESTLQRGSLLPGGLWRIDAKRHFEAAVDAVLFVGATRGGGRRATVWPVFSGLEARRPSAELAIVDGAIVIDRDAYRRTEHLAGSSEPEWRSGLKHDCSRVMELSRSGGRWVNGLGEEVAIERELVFPLLKSSDVANGVALPSRAVVVPQRTLGEDTAQLRRHAPRAWRYLSAHGELLGARKSSIYRGQPRFSVFGVGPYTFAPWKVAISGLYKRHQFTLIGPHDGRSVILDDTCYFLPFPDERRARRACQALLSPIAREFFEARVFWDAKRPITKALLQTLDLRALLKEA